MKRKICSIFLIYFVLVVQAQAQTAQYKGNLSIWSTGGSEGSVLHDSANRYAEDDLLGSSKDGSISIDSGAFGPDNNVSLSISGFSLSLVESTPGAGAGLMGYYESIRRQYASPGYFAGSPESSLSTKPRISRLRQFPSLTLNTEDSALGLIIGKTWPGAGKSFERFSVSLLVGNRVWVQNSRTFAFIMTETGTGSTKVTSEAMEFEEMESSANGSFLGAHIRMEQLNSRGFYFAVEAFHHSFSSAGGNMTQTLHAGGKGFSTFGMAFADYQVSGTSSGLSFNFGPDPLLFRLGMRSETIIISYPGYNKFLATTVGSVSTSGRQETDFLTDMMTWPRERQMSNSIFEAGVMLRFNFIE